MKQAEFDALAAQGYTRIPLVLETFADLDTPLSVYLKLANKPYSYLFESVQGGERFARYSIIGLPARTVLRVIDGKISVSEDGREIEVLEGDPLAAIDAFNARYKAAPLPYNLRFVGGLVGYFGYDTVRYIEPRLAATRKDDAIGIADILLMLSEELAIVDNLSGKLYIVVYVDPTRENAFAHGEARLADLRRALSQSVAVPEHRPTASIGGEPKSNFPKEDFLAAVARCKRYITDGDIMQVQISQRIEQPFAAEPINLYRALRSINPSPYMFFVHLDAFHIVGASPEILVRLEDGTVTLRPIAGTRKRGKTNEEDLALEQELLNDPKERAEHLMLIDLGRNDVGRVAQTGSVKVTENMIVERYSHVMHIVSNVEGEIRPGINAIELLRATFPAGTVTGTPKVRAMEIIDELEPAKRGVYAGAVGYIGFNGNMDLAIAIRTALIKDGTLYVQAAAGIVADSVPELEWQETQNKARGVLRAAELALQGLDGEGAPCS